MKTIITSLTTLAIAYAILLSNDYHIVKHDECIYRAKLIKLVKAMNDTQDRINAKLGVK